MVDVKARRQVRANSSAVDSRIMAGLIQDPTWETCPVDCAVAGRSASADEVPGLVVTGDEHRAFSRPKGRKLDQPCANPSSMVTVVVVACIGGLPLA